MYALNSCKSCEAAPTPADPTAAPPTAEAVPTAPAPTEASPTEASPTEAAPTEASPTEAAPTEASPTEAAPTAPPPTEPAPTGPPPTEPAPTAPPPTEPAPTEPAPTDAPGPAPTESAPTDAPGPDPTPEAPTDAPGPAPTPDTPTDAPGPEPTPEAPTDAPGPEPTPPGGAPTNVGVCPTDPVTVNFDKAANGTALPAGLYVEKEWETLGLTLFAEGGVGTLPRLFDTANPGGATNDDCGDRDLGAPNKECPGGGPGEGVGGEPGAPGENCDPLGNVLIIQEPGEDCPDDNVDGVSYSLPNRIRAISFDQLSSCRYSPLF